MTRFLTIALPLAATLAVSAASAEGLVPGSDTGTRDAQAFADNAVGSGRYVDPAPTATGSYGYPTSAPAVASPTLRGDAAVPRGATERGRVAAPASGSLVPGSDSF